MLLGSLRQELTRGVTVCCGQRSCSKLGSAKSESF